MRSSPVESPVNARTSWVRALARTRPEKKTLADACRTWCRNWRSALGTPRRFRGPETLELPRARARASRLPLGSRARHQVRRRRCLLMANCPHYLAVWLGIMRSASRSRSSIPISPGKCWPLDQPRGPRAHQRSAGLADAVATASGDQCCGATGVQGERRANLNASTRRCPADPARHFQPTQRSVSRSMIARSTCTPPARLVAQGRDHRPSPPDDMEHWFAGMMDTSRLTACTTACRSITASVASWPLAPCWSMAARCSSGRNSRPRSSGTT